MKKFPKLVQSDKRGQIVIPKDIRAELGIDEGTGFYMYSINEEGIFLKKIKDEDLDSSKELQEINDKAEKIDVDPNNITKTKKEYKKTTKGNLELL